MPRIVEISYGRTFNDGDYESTRLDVKAELEVNENYEDAFISLYDSLVVLRDLQLDQVPKPTTPSRGRRP